MWWMLPRARGAARDDRGVDITLVVSLRSGRRLRRFVIDPPSGLLFHDSKRVKYAHPNLIAAKVPSPLPKALGAGCSPAQLRSAVDKPRHAALGEVGGLATVGLRTQ
jgi:hypothetical protein